MRVLKTVGILCLVSFGTQYVWELLHISLYTGYQQLGGGANITLYATLGDVLYTMAAVLLVALFKRQANWVPRALKTDYLGLALLGFCIALLVEYKALALHRWAYTAAMPLVLGVGVSPLLQMTLLLPFSVYITKRFVSARG